MKLRRWMILLVLGFGLLGALAVAGSFGRATLAHPAVPGNPVLSPSPNVLTASATTDVAITYSEAISPGTVSTDTFAVFGRMSGLVTGTYAVNGREIRLVPSQPFLPGEPVDAIATQGLESLAGESPSVPTVWQFTTGVTGGTGWFVDSGLRLDDWTSYDATVADFNGDDHLDVVFAINRYFNNQFDGMNICLNDGNAGFSCTTTGRERCRVIEAGDFDGDSDVDLFCWGPGSSSTYLNNGQGSFSRNDYSDLIGAGDGGLGDFDGDGNLDYLAFAATAKFYMSGTDTGDFVETYVFSTTSASALEVGDLDGDGTLEVFAALEDAPDEIWRYDPASPLAIPFVRDHTVGDSSFSYDLKLGDLNGDGHLDAFVGKNGPDYVWFNDGSGNFTDSGQRLGDELTQRLAMGDLDGDGDLDVYAIHSGTPNNVWLNDGTGTFEHPFYQVLPSGSETGIDLGDFDGNGSLDVAISNSAGPDTIWLNRSAAPADEYPEAHRHDVALDAPVGMTVTGVLTPTSGTALWVHGYHRGPYTGTYAYGSHTLELDPAQTFFPGEVVETTALTVTSDGDTLVPFVWRFRAEVAGGSGQFVDSGLRQDDNFSEAVALGDMDGDGDLDVVDISTDWGDDAALWLNSGGAYTFTKHNTFPATTSDRDVALGDLNNDGLLDVFFAGGGSSSPDNPNLVYLNSGGGSLSLAWQLGNEKSRGVALGDLNRDGRLDAFFANYESANQVWLNWSDDLFTTTQQLFPTELSYDVVLGDLDSDGDLDAFVANDGPNTVWLNVGSGYFVDSGQALTHTQPYSLSWRVELGDLDGDGDLDAFVAEDGPDTVWINDGSGGFTDSGQLLGSDTSYDVALGDVDNDGDLDAVVAGIGANVLWLNNGAGQFVNSGVTLGTLKSGSVALGDMDNDGDLDVFIGNMASPPRSLNANELWFNKGVADLQVVKAGQPARVGPGGTLTYTLTLSNLGPDTATTVWITDILPSELMNVASLASTGVTLVSSTTWRINLLTVGSQEAITITGVVTATPGQLFSLSNSATITSEFIFDPQLANNDSTVQSTVDAQPPSVPVLSGPADGGRIADLTPTLTWNASPESDVAGYLVTVDGNVVDVGLATAYTAEALSEAMHTWTVAAYDDVGNVSAYADTWSFVVDVTPPAVPELLVPAEGSVVTTTTLTLEWSASPEADTSGYFVRVDGGAAVDVGNVTQYTPAALSQGDHTWTVAAYDDLGNTSSYATAWGFVVDTTPPSTPVLQSPPDGAYTSDTAVRLSWAANPEPDVIGYRLDFGGTVIDLGLTTAYTTPVLAEGRYTWTVSAYDHVGWESAFAASRAFTVDTTAPSLVAFAPADGEAEVPFNAPLVITFSERMAPGSLDYSLAPDPQGWTAQWNAGGDVVMLRHNPFTYNTTYTVTLASAADVAGNSLSDTPVVWSFTTVSVTDATPPQVVSVTPVDGASGVSVNTPLTVNFSEPMNAPSLSYAVSPDPGGWEVVWDANGESVTLSHTAFDFGVTYTVVVTGAEDLAGNALANAPYTWSFTTSVDLTPPEPPVLLNPADGAVLSDTAPVLTWAASSSEDVAGYRLNFNGTITDVGATTAYTVAPPLSDGAYTWTVAAYDLAGNVSDYPAAWSFSVDTTPPALEGHTPADGAVDVAPGAPIVLTFSEAIVPESLSYTLSRDPGGWDATWNAAGDVVTLTHNLLVYNTTYTFTLNAAADPASNALDSAPVTWSFTTVSVTDAISPQIISVAPVDGLTDVKPSAPLVVEFSEAIDATSLSYTIQPADPGNWAAEWSASGGVVTLTHAPFTTTTHYTVTVVGAADLAGNALTNAPYSWSFTTGRGETYLYLPLVLR